eukprot:7859071-Pyramimonas_sp.AAC.1
MPHAPAAPGAPCSGHAQSVPGAPTHETAHIGKHVGPTATVEHQCAISAGWPSWCLLGLRAAGDMPAHPASLSKTNAK